MVTLPSQPAAGAPSSVPGAGAGKAAARRRRHQAGAVGSIATIEATTTPTGRPRRAGRAGPAAVVSGAALVGSAVALSVWEGLKDRGSPAAHAGVIVAIVVTAAVAAVAGHHRQRLDTRAWVSAPFDTTAARGPGRRVGMVVWAALLAAPVAWDLFSFLHRSHQTPTLSWIIGQVTAFHPGRATLFALWLAAGVALALGGRRRGRPC